MTHTHPIEQVRGTAPPRLITHKINHFGVTAPVYRIADQRVHNRIDAIETAIQHGHEWPGFQVWDRSITMPEPRESFMDLAKAHARGVRDRAKRIRLWYSGGFDSHTMLRSFLESGLRVDEIAIYRRLPGYEDGITNVEIDYIDMPEQVRQFCDRHGSHPRIRVYNVLPHHYRWYGRNAFQHYIKHKAIQDHFCVQIHHVMECYPELVDPDTLNVAGTPDAVKLEDDGFRILDGGFNWCIAAPNTMFFFSDQSAPELMFKLAYRLRDHEALAATSAHVNRREVVNDVKRDLGFTALNHMLEKKFSGGISLGEQPFHVHDRKNLLYIANAMSTWHGKRMMVQYRNWHRGYGRDRAKYVEGPPWVNQHICGVGEKHYFHRDTVDITR